MLRTCLLMMGVACMALGVPVYLEPQDLVQMQELPMVLADLPVIVVEEIVPSQRKTEPLQPDLEKGASRVRRSPQGLSILGQALPGGGGSLRAQLEGLNWTSGNGKHSIQGTAHYQRNFGVPGPRQNYGVQAQYTFKF